MYVGTGNSATAGAETGEGGDGSLMGHDRSDGCGIELGGCGGGKCELEGTSDKLAGAWVSVVNGGVDGGRTGNGGSACGGSGVCPRISAGSP